MPDREKVIAGLEECLELLNCIGTQSECKKYVSDALALLKEQEHKDKMFHALEDDWKLLNKLLKEQETEIAELRSIVEFWKEKALHT